MRNCPLCGNELSEADIVCSACVMKINLNEPKRREMRIRNVADTLVVVLAVFFFMKGAFAMWEKGGYTDFVASLGYPIGSSSLQFLNASICILAALGYAITALGNYLAKPWTLRVCLITFCFFVGAQLLVQLGDIHEGFGFTKALSVVFFLSSVPALQFAMSMLGVASERIDAPAEGGMQPPPR